MSRCTALVRGHSSPRGAAKCPACSAAPTPHLDAAAPPLDADAWEVRRVLSLPRAGRRAAALDANTSPRVLARLARDQCGEICRYVAANQATHPSTLVWLARQIGDEWLLANVARNLNCPSVLVESIARGEMSAPPQAGLRQVGQEEAQGVRKERMWRDLGIHADNAEARECLIDRWWTLDADSVDVAVVLQMFPNP